ncbi:HNH endonuclease [Chryseobacterium sp. MDT2-18]|uniref:HNH endonuclease n=1 Tax=Chryseobacterium sp. MDT2-18 TaxID=1259136 RepID=UPI00278B7422|nr:HNH endonuclease [Chryseobacterium sp. MDT2-18]MDQ0477468.1 hypothetical protein [Chryseobacterium sp. MDT2-18]
MQKKCILCDGELIDKSYYESNKSEFDLIPKFKHKEHIIQNAIGGRLKSDEILCEECGGILNKEIDTDFLKLFTGFTERLKDILPKERNKNSKTPVNGYEVGTKREIVYLDKTIVPKNPDFEINETEKTIKIYASKNIINHYKKHVLNTISKKRLNINEYTIVEISEFKDDENIGLLFTEGVENFNDKWKMGFIKIATEFAYLNGVEKEHLTNTLDIQNKKIINSHNIFPFFPIGLTDAFIEWHRIFLEKNFPTHTIILFTQEYKDNQKELICYVDLFSTFQYYILLNSDYKGESVFKTYCQKLEKEIKAEINFREIRIKYLRMIAEENEINLNLYKGKSIEELYDFLETEYAKKTANYELNLEEEISYTLSNLLNALLYSKSKSQIDLGYLSEPVNSLKNISTEWFMTILAEINHLKPEEGIINIQRYRQVFMEQDGKNNLENLSTPNEIAKCIENDLNFTKEYCHLKFNHLAYFVGKKSKKE